MTQKLYDNSHLTEFEATVLESREDDGFFWTLLDKTAFFAEGGGQPSDKGRIDGVEIFDVQIRNNEIYHKSKNPLTVGKVVTGVVDFERRLDFMQQHSGEHIVSGVARKLFGCENVGFHLSDDIVTLDLDKPLDQKQLLEIEQGANQKVYDNVDFNIYYPDDETLKTLDYRCKKELEGEIRIVDIDTVDRCACCAPHVKKSGEIGIIKLLSHEKLRGGTRIEIKCGKRALTDYNDKYANVSAISSALCVKQNETANAVDRLLSQIGELKAVISEMKREKINSLVESFEPQGDVTAEFEDGLEIKDMQHFCDALYKKTGGIRAVFSKNEKGIAFVICGDTEKLDDWFKEFKNQFTVRGGGRNGMVSGTVLADIEEIKRYF